MPKRFLIFLPTPTLFYFNQALGLRSAFLKRGIDCLLHVEHPELPDVTQYLASYYKPDAVLSINNFKPEVLERYPEITHIRWIQDNFFRGVDYRKPSNAPLSDICYVMLDRLKHIVHMEAKRHIGVLPFGAVLSTDFRWRSAPQSPFSVIAWIPPGQMLDKRYNVTNGQSFTGRDYVQFLSTRQQESVDFPLEQLDSLVKEFFDGYGATMEGASDNDLAPFREFLIRASNRSRLLKAILALGHGCRIYGGPEWQTWREFAPYYKGALPTMDDCVQVYQTTTLNPHNGAMIAHPRVLDCMAAYGGPILANRCGVPDREIGAVAGIHYVEYDLSDLREVASRFLNDHAARERISSEAYRLVESRHTWDIRASQILADMAR